MTGPGSPLAKWPGVSRLHGAARHYAWGDRSFLPRLLGVELDGKPWAEWWLGAHPSLPSSVDMAQGPRPLDTLSDSEWRALLGPGRSGEPGRFPFLLKVLCAAEPLSIQVHPSSALARDGFEDEERRGVPLAAPRRNYKDPFPKPELLVALTPFHALMGFASAAEVEASVAPHAELAPLLAKAFAVSFDAAALLEWTLHRSQDEVDSMLGPLLGRLRTEHAAQVFRDETLEYWLLRSHATFSSDEHCDRGLLALFLLARRKLAPGEGLYVPAGVPHAYLEGCGIEVMAPSDNVLRCGLTPKHVDVDEVLRVLDRRVRPFEPVRPEPVPAAGGSTVRWPTPPSWFTLERVTLEPGAVIERGPRRGPQIVLVTEVAAPDVALELRTENSTLRLGRGGSALIRDASLVQCSCDGRVVAFVAGVPEEQRPPSAESQR